MLYRLFVRFITGETARRVNKAKDGNGYKNEGKNKCGSEGANVFNKAHEGEVGGLYLLEIN